LLFRHSAFPQHYVSTQNSALAFLFLANAIQVPALAILNITFAAGTKLSHCFDFPRFSFPLLFCPMPLRGVAVQFQCVTFLVNAFAVHG
jgi:hypothetical protein